MDQELCVSVIGLKSWPVAAAGQVVTRLTRNASRTIRLGSADRSDFSFTLPAKTDLGTLFGEFHSQTHSRSAMATVEEHIGTVNWQVDLQLPPLGTLGMPTTNMLLDLVHALDSELVSSVNHLHNAAWRGTLVLTADHHHQVSRADLHRSHHLTGQADDFHETSLPKFPRNRAENSGAPGILVFIDQHDRVAIEADVAAVETSRGLSTTNDHTSLDTPLANLAPWQRFLNTDDNNVAQAGGPTPGTAQHLDTPRDLRTGVVSDVELSLHLDHGFTRFWPRLSRRHSIWQ
jgi:hypothetical protein